MTVLHRLALWCALAGGAVGSAVALMVVVSIVGRRWSMPIPGDVELTQFGIALSIALCLPWCQLQRGNVLIDFFTRKAGPRTVRGLAAIGHLLLAAMVGLLAWRSASGALAVREAGETTMILSLPMWWSYAALAPGLALTALIAVSQILTPGEDKA